MHFWRRGRPQNDLLSFLALDQLARLLQTQLSFAASFYAAWEFLARHASSSR
jgi:hypothetical protein